MSDRLKYRDGRGNVQELTFTQWVYLRDADRMGGFDYGWGGHRSTLTVRLLRERGLITLDDFSPRPGRRWRVTGLTTRGEQVLIAWAAKNGGAA